MEDPRDSSLCRAAKLVSDAESCHSLPRAGSTTESDENTEPNAVWVVPGRDIVEPDPNVPDVPGRIGNCLLPGRLLLPLVDAFSLLCLLVS